MKTTSTIFSTITALALVILSLVSTLPVLAATVKGVVMDADKITVANATVWLIPAADVASMSKIPIVIKRDASNDEPLEDNLAANRNSYRHAKTNAKGKFSLNSTDKGKFFLYVEPANSKYLPGGDKSRNALSLTELSVAAQTIKISGNIPAGSSYVGTSKCLKCHEEQEHFTQTLHRLGIKALGKDSKLQDYSRFPNFNQGLDKLMAGTKFWLYNFNKKRSFDKYMISDHQPEDMSSVSYTATFYKDSDGTLKFRTENVRDPSDPARVYPVELTYGGGLYKQRYIYRVGANVFPFVQFNEHGKASYGSRTRKPWRDYHGDWLYNEKLAKLKNPPQGKSFDKNCASCHYSGYSLTKTTQGDYIANSTNDRHSELDIDGDGVKNELNMGCETCHGPGSVHAKSEESVSIVSPDKLASERASMICGQCHDRAQGHLNNDQTVNSDWKMMLPGTSRNAYLNQYTTREGPAAKNFWPDGFHSKSHHQQYSDFIKSSKYRNDKQLVTCFDCHNTHGSKFVHQLREDPQSAKICTSCHKNTPEMQKHVVKTTKCTVKPDKITCLSCHNTKTMQTGAGMGKGMIGKDGKNYWVNDIASHLYDVPRKDNPLVKGIDPGKAMPIPYTNACGAACHDTSNL